MLKVEKLKKGNFDLMASVKFGDLHG